MRNNQKAIEAYTRQLKEGEIESDQDSARGFLNKQNTSRDFSYPLNYFPLQQEHLESVEPRGQRPEDSLNPSTAQNQKARQFIGRDVLSSDILESTHTLNSKKHHLNHSKASRRQLINEFCLDQGIP